MTRARLIQLLEQHASSNVTEIIAVLVLSAYAATFVKKYTDAEQFVSEMMTKNHSIVHRTLTQDETQKLTTAMHTVYDAVTQGKNIMITLDQVLRTVYPHVNKADIKTPAAVNEGLIPNLGIIAPGIFQAVFNVVTFIGDVGINSILGTFGSFLGGGRQRY
jgi:hypothetical protein